VSTAPPLSHLRVVDLTDLRGALAGRMLGDLGAEVFKVEPPGGDPERLRPPFAGGRAGPDGSLAFLFRNANKRGVVVDLETEAGRERLARLCEQADVLLENLAPDARARWGLEPEAVRARYPRLVHVAIADCGLSGPRAAWRLEPLPALAASGALFQSGPPELPPCGLPGFVAHDCAAAVALVGALAAVLERRRTGAGQTVEVSVEEAALALLAPWGIPMVDYARRYPLLPAELTRDGDGPAVVVPAADGWVRLLAVTPRQLRGLASLLAGGWTGAPAAAEPEPRRGPQGEPGPEGASGAPRRSRGGVLEALQAKASHAATLGARRWSPRTGRWRTSTTRSPTCGRAGGSGPCSTAGRSRSSGGAAGAVLAAGHHADHLQRSGATAGTAVRPRKSFTFHVMIASAA